MVDGRADVRRLVNITIDEWEKYDWLEVTTYGDLAHGHRVYIKGEKLQGPPQDGFVYVELPHGEYARAKQPEPSV